MANEVRRINKGFLAKFETPALYWLARQMPIWVTPNLLTGIGFLGAIVAFFGYAASAFFSEFLWVATLGLVINWFGDSLDGTLARYRRIERPRYGFYLDNSIDVIEQMLIAVGLTLSNIIRVELALLGLAAFYAMSILTYIRLHIFEEFTLDYGGFGPTELRVAFIVVNLLVFYIPPQPFSIFNLTYPEVLSVIWLTLTVITFSVIVLRDVSKLANEEPPRTDHLT